MLNKRLQQRLHERRELQLWRHRCLRKIDANRVLIDGHACIDFSSNDYLGLSQHPEVIACAQTAMQQYGVGGRSSQLIAGYTAAHRDLDNTFSDFMQYPRAIVLSSGYVANKAIIGSLLQGEDRLFLDRLSHASMIDAARESGLRFQRYRHADVDHLKELLTRYTNDVNFVASDSVFSMDGDLVDLAALSRVVKTAGASMIVDDAHGFGVLGNSGRGALEHFNLSFKDVPILCIPMGKAIGCNGAVVLADELVIESLIQFARPYIYSTAISPAICVAATKSVSLIAQGHLQKKLHENIRYFRECAKQSDLAILDSLTAGQGLVIGDNATTSNFSHQLLQKGFFVKAILPPTVPKGQARLRVSLSAIHRREDIEKLVEALTKIKYELPLEKQAREQFPLPQAGDAREQSPLPLAGEG